MIRALFSETRHFMVLDKTENIQQCGKLLEEGLLEHSSGKNRKNIEKKR